mgnify:CR=1 FL=1
MLGVVQKALILLIVSLLFDDSFNISVLFFHVSIVDVFFLIFSIAMFIYCLNSPHLIHISRKSLGYLFLIFGLLLLVLLNLTSGASINENIRLSIGMIEGVLITVALIIFIRTEEQLDSIGNVFLLIALLASITSLLVGFSFVDWPYIDKTPPTRSVFSIILPWNRNAGLFSNYSAYNSIILIGASYSFVKFYYNSGFKKICYFLFLIILIFGSFMPQSRAAILALGVLFLAYIFWFSKKKFLLTMLILSLVILGSFMFYAVAEVFIEIGSSSSETRFEQYALILEILPEVYLQGKGLGSFISEYGNSIHNIFLNVLIAFGIPGLVFFLSIILLPYLHMFVQSKKLTLELVGKNLSWIPLSLISVCAVLFFASGLSLLSFWILIGTMISLVSTKLCRSD